MTAQWRPAKDYKHDGPVVVVPGRVARWLSRYGLNQLRINAQGIDPEVDAVLLALHHAGLAWATSAAAEAGAEVPSPSAEVVPVSEWMNAQQAADQLGISDRAVRLAIADRRLPAERIDGRWRIAREDVTHFGTATRSVM